MGYKMVIIKMFCFVVVIIATLEIDSICVNGQEPFKTVQTHDGGVRGAKKTTEYKKVDYYAFRGIPYAEKPIGDLRFKAPKPKKSWKPTVLDALEFGSVCPQRKRPRFTYNNQSEDCLFLNIYVPADVKENEKLPVLFFIFGGRYSAGSGNDDFYGPDFFIEKHVILITFNYRLGIFGFLSLNLPEYSGNMGLKDQQLALKWIHKNIEHFNGDCKTITIFGSSSGGISVHHHTLSSESRKYFQNAIMMSGSLFQYLAMSECNDHLDLAHRIANKAGKSFTDTNELAKFLVSQPTETYGLNWDVWTDRRLSFKLTPVIERPDAREAFMTKTIENLYETEDIRVNTLFTFTSAEFMLFTMKSYPENIDFAGLNTNFSIKLPFKSLNLSQDSQEYRAINKEIRQFYFGNDVIENSKSAEYVSLFSDLNFCYAVDKTAKLHAIKSKGKTYYARFDVDSKLNIFKRAWAVIQVPGAAHIDDLCYLFLFGVAKPFYDNVFGTPEDVESKTSLQAIDHMTNLFTNFAKLDHSGKSPIPGFKPIQNGEINFLDITNNGLIPGVNPNGKAMDFWMNIEKRLLKYIAVNRYGRL